MESRQKHDQLFRILVLTGSLRKDSITRKMAKFLISIAPQVLQAEIIELGALPMYNEDLDTASPPAAWRAFREQVRAADGFLFVTPEYNRSVPAVLKNAIDIGSAPHDRNVFRRKPAAIVSVSPGMMGAFGANHHLRQSLVFLDMPTMQQPEAYIGSSESLFDENGTMTRQSTADYLKFFMETFAQWVKHYHTMNHV